MSISVICACKNRTKPLEISLTSWLMFEEIQEIIITDWSSNEPIDHLMKYDEKVKVISVTGEKYFNQPQPLNLAASIATGDYILKLDSDTILNPYYNFFKKYLVDNNSFVSGRNFSKDPVYAALWGTLYFSKFNFEKIGGYNENMGKYASWEDSEILIRLKLLGLQEININPKDLTCVSIPHSHKKRIENFELYNTDKSLEEKIKTNYNMSEDMRCYTILMKHHQINSQKYNPTGYYIEPVVKWELEQISSQQYKAQKILNK